MTRLFTLIAFILFSTCLIAQDVVLDKNTDDQYVEKKGPNMRYYGHFYEGIGIVTPYESNVGAEVDFFRSPEFIFGYRYKLKLLSFYAIGFDLSNRWTRYGIKSDESLTLDATNPLSFASNVKKMGVGVSCLGAEVWNRINIGKRGNILGNYIDIGIKGEWNYLRRMIIKEVAPENSYYEKSRTVQKNLNLVEKFSTVVTARVGINKVSLYGNYRISELISMDDYSTPDLPPLTVGIQLAF